MKTKNQITKTAQQVEKLERKLALDKIKQRKADTRRKIEFGGLVIKAKMDNYSKDVILGSLLDAKEQIEKEGKAQHALYKAKGHAVFMGFEE